MSDNIDYSKLVSQASGIQFYSPKKTSPDKIKPEINESDNSPGIDDLTSDKQGISGSFSIGSSVASTHLGLAESPVDTKGFTELKNYKIEDQGDTNACGTTSMSSVMNHYGVKTTRNDVDQKIRSQKFDSYTPAQNMVDYAKSQGFRAGIRNNGNLEEVAGYIDKGVPVIVFTDTTPETPEDTGIHWNVVIGYKRDKKGKIDKLKIAEPSGGYTTVVKAEDFKKDWKNTKIGGNVPYAGKQSMDTGYNNMYIVVAPKDNPTTTPDGKKVSPEKIEIPNDSPSNLDTFGRGLATGAKIIDDGISTYKAVEKKAGEIYKESEKFVEQAEKTVKKQIDHVSKLMGLS